jgi:hypothetical protein
VAPKLITATKWDINLGSTDCKQCGTNKDSLQVFYDHGSQAVVIHYTVGCSGGENRYEDTIGEAIAWLKHTKRLWYEYESSIDSVIQSLEKHLEQ